MIRLLTDENFNQDIVRGLGRRLPQLELLSVRDAGLLGQPDMFLLQRAAQENRTILTHDKKTMSKYAEQLIIQDALMTGVIVVPDRLPIGRAINDLELALECYSETEMVNRIEFLPY